MGSPHFAGLPFWGGGGLLGSATGASKWSERIRHSQGHDCRKIAVQVYRLVTNLWLSC
jgi:hypothetical protein